MSRNQTEVSASGSILIVLVILTAIILERGLIVNERWYWGLLFTIPALILALLDIKLARIKTK